MTTPPPPAPAPYGGYVPPAPTNPLAIVSLVLSILGAIAVLPLLGSIGGIITGHIARGQVRERGEQGDGLAKAGVIVGWVGLALAVLGGLAIVFFFVVIAASS